MSGFFYDSENDNQNFTSIVHGVCPRSLEFLPFNIDNVAVSDCCNGLILCWCLRANGYCYIVCNLMTQNFKILLPSTHDVGHAVGEARLGFDPIASLHFHVIEYVDVDVVCVGVEIYSSQTATWIYKDSEWGEDTDVTFYRQPSVFLNSCLHIMGHSGEYPMILVVDMEENIRRKIDGPSGLQHSMHQALGHLCVCTVGGPNDSKLSIWILEDYGIDNWTLKHTVTTWILFERINIRFGFPDFVDGDIVITVHPEWNLIFFAGVDGTIIAYDMDRISACVIPA
ncbi:uncharacterized protein [Miscanthus floridulus]|uniref:uncharacterized protein n=1 Tax=Miscanthus floridulus TaxID=154761 RepID=UPI003459A3A2